MRGLPGLPVVREFLRAKVRGRRHGPVAVVLWRLLVAGLWTVAAVGLATMGLFFSTAPQWVSLALEPLSLLLMPGFVVGLVLAGPHDLDPAVIMQATIIFYMVLFFVLLSWRWKRRAR